MMKRYMERIWELMSDPNAKKNVPLYDETLPKGVSFDQLRIITGRVYAYLKARNKCLFKKHLLKKKEG